MDRMIYTALNALAVNRDTQVLQAQNLANQNVPGYRRDLPNEGGTFYLGAPDALNTRAFQLETGAAGFSAQQGRMDRTDMPLDLAIADQGYFYIQADGGEPALSRRGDLRRDSDGILRNGAGEAMLNDALEPIQLPAGGDIRITDIGEIYVTAADAPDGPPALVGILATVIPPEGMALTKGEDGRIRPAEGPLPPPDQRAKVMQGVLETSNVNPVEEMLSSMQVQREFEMGMRLMLAARDLDESGARLMQAPEG